MSKREADSDETDNKPAHLGGSDSGADGGSSRSSMSKTQNAFQTLMSASKKQKQAQSPDKPSTTTIASLSSSKKPTSRSSKSSPAHRGGTLNQRDGRNALLNYLLAPEQFANGPVLTHNDTWVVLRDAFPKGAVHVLLMPRDLSRADSHPLTALQDPEFLAQVTAEVSNVKRLAASELRRRFGAGSAAEQARREAMCADDEGETESAGKLPPGRDWEAELEVGVHAAPSMNHLHVHVVSREYCGGSHGKSGRHYQTFKTPYFVRLEEFPLPEGDERLLESEQRHVALKKYLGSDLCCWRCARNFGRAWKELYRHLEEEYDAWKKE